MLNPRVVECECRKYEVVESKVVESKFVEFMLHSRRASSSVRLAVSQPIDSTVRKVDSRADSETGIQEYMMTDRKSDNLEIRRKI